VWGTALLGKVLMGGQPPPVVRRAKLDLGSGYYSVDRVAGPVVERSSTLPEVLVSHYV